MNFKQTLFATSLALAAGGVQATDVNVSGRDMLSSGLRSQIDFNLANMNEKPNACTRSDLECAIASSIQNNGPRIKDLGIRLNYQNGGFRSYLKLGPQSGGKINLGVEYKF